MPTSCSAGDLTSGGSGDDGSSVLKPVTLRTAPQDARFPTTNQVGACCLLLFIFLLAGDIDGAYNTECKASLEGRSSLQGEGCLLTFSSARMHSADLPAGQTACVLGSAPTFARGVLQHSLARETSARPDP